MKSRQSIAATVLLAGVLAIATSEPHAAGQETDWRVVVQDAHPVVLAVGPAGKIAAAHGRDAQHVLYVVDLEQEVTLLARNLPGRIASAAVAPDGKWLAVSTDEEIYRVMAAGGEAEAICPGAAGYLAISEDGSRLAVLSGRQESLSRYDECRLGIYDLNEKSWLAKAETPILVAQQVLFDGGRAVAYGQGGRVFHRRASSFECDVRLDAGTGEAAFSRGPETEFGRAAAGDDGTEFADYQAPPMFLRQREKIEEAQRAVVSAAESLSPSMYPAGDEGTLAFLADAAGVTAVVARRKHFAAVLTIERDGRISCRPAESMALNGLRQCGGRLLALRGGDGGGAVVDCLTGEELLLLPKEPGQRGWQRILDGGCLTWEEGKVAFYPFGKPDESWTFEHEALHDAPFPLVLSQDGRFLALGFGQDSADQMIGLRADSGKVAFLVPRGEDRESNGYCLCAAFSGRGDRLAVMLRNSRLQVHSVMGGELVAEHEFGEKAYMWYVSSAGEGWLLGGEAESMFFDDAAGPGAAFPCRTANRATLLTALGEPAVAFETRYGVGGIVRPDTGELAAKWISGDFQGHQGPPEDPARTIVAAEGRLLVRGTAAGSLELIDTRTLKEVATIHYLPIGERMEWIAATPDGYWDCSPPAAGRVAIFAGGDRAGAAAKELRRRPRIIRERIAAMFAGN